MVRLEEPERQIHGDHEEFAMSEIDDTNDSEDERKADAQKRIDAAQQKPRNSDLNKELHAVPSPGIRIDSRLLRGGALPRLLARTTC